MEKVMKDEWGVERNVTVISEDETKPFLEYEYTQTIRLKKYNPKFGDNRMCVCGHPYHRHFDFYESTFVARCKYCGCDNFVEQKNND